MSSLMALFATPTAATAPVRSPRQQAQIEAARRNLEEMGVAIVVGDTTVHEVRRELAR